jgi:hypothetical protein
MNCPTCGAENEADARFCAECGAPLEEEDDDRTIMSSVDQISEEARTVSVSQDDVAELEAEMEAEAAEAEPEAASPPSSPPTGSSGGGNDGFMNQRNIIIAVVVLLVLCLCCCVIAVIAAWASGEIEISRVELDLLPHVLPLV